MRYLCAVYYDCAFAICYRRQCTMNIWIRTKFSVFITIGNRIIIKFYLAFLGYFFLISARFLKTKIGTYNTQYAKLFARVTEVLIYLPQTDHSFTNGYNQFQTYKFCKTTQYFRVFFYELPQIWWVHRSDES